MRNTKINVIMISLLLCWFTPNLLSCFFYFLDIFCYFFLFGYSTRAHTIFGTCFLNHYCYYICCVRLKNKKLVGYDNLFDCAFKVILISFFDQNMRT